MEEKLEMLQSDILRVMNGMEHEERALLLRELAAWCQNEETDALKMAYMDDRDEGWQDYLTKFRNR